MRGTWWTDIEYVYGGQISSGTQVGVCKRVIPGHDLLLKFGGRTEDRVKINSGKFISVMLGPPAWRLGWSAPSTGAQHHFEN